MQLSCQRRKSCCVRNVNSGSVGCCSESLLNCKGGEPVELRRNCYKKKPGVGKELQSWAEERSVTGHRHTRHGWCFYPAPISVTRTSITFVCVSPVLRRSPVASKKE